MNTVREEGEEQRVRTASSAPKGLQCHYVLMLRVGDAMRDVGGERPKQRVSEERWGTLWGEGRGKVCA